MEGPIRPCGLERPKADLSDLLLAIPLGLDLISHSRGWPWSAAEELLSPLFWETAPAPGFSVPCRWDDKDLEPACTNPSYSHIRLILTRNRCRLRAPIFRGATER